MLENDLYDVLGINVEGSEQEIKRSYIRKIREFPPEQYPEEFKKIRNAYETLSNPQTRKEYDTMAIYGDAINAMLEKGQQYMTDGEYYEASDIFKKILVIESSLNNVRNLYALALSYQGVEEQEKAITQFKRLIEFDPHNATYYYNLGLTLESLELYEEALDWLKKGYLSDPDNVDLVFSIVDVYTNLKRHQNAKDVLESALNKLEQFDFRSFIFLFKLLQVDIFLKNYKHMASTFARLEKLLLHNSEEKPYVANRYAKLAFELLGNKAFEQAYYMTEKALELDPNNDHIQDLHKHVATMKPIFVEFEMLEEDDHVSDYLKRIYVIYLYGDEVSDEEREEYDDVAFDNLYKATKYFTDEIIKSIRRIIVNYPNLFEAKKELLQKAMESSKYYKSVTEQYEMMNNDSSIINSLRRYISLLLSDEISEEERDHNFRDIMDEMEDEASSRINRSIQRLNQAYPALYKLNNSFFDQIRERTAGSSPSSSPYSNHSNISNSSACFVATVAYGSPLVEELDFLRLWRDKVLKCSWNGRVFVSFYYKFGPHLAMIVGKSDWMKRSVRWFIYKLIQYLDKKYTIQEGSE